MWDCFVSLSLGSCPYESMIAGGITPSNPKHRGANGWRWQSAGKTGSGNEAIQAIEQYLLQWIPGSQNNRGWLGHATHYLILSLWRRHERSSLTCYEWLSMMRSLHCVRDDGTNSLFPSLREVRYERRSNLRIKKCFQNFEIASFLSASVRVLTNRWLQWFEETQTTAGKAENIP